ncbi:hypothetical protein niasHT_029033 [Heterodera trifolii]|uniref:Uncharacterized protein n=1 Tax=Heterodera trifolii TaxID=157864 RepID=A0ABD2K8L0_9BILA
MLTFFIAIYTFQLRPFLQKCPSLSTPNPLPSFVPHRKPPTPPSTSVSGFDHHSCSAESAVSPLANTITSRLSDHADGMAASRPSARHPPRLDVKVACRRAPPSRSSTLSVMADSRPQRPANRLGPSRFDYFPLEMMWVETLENYFTPGHPAFFPRQCMSERWQTAVLRLKLPIFPPPVLRISPSFMRPNSHCFSSLSLPPRLDNKTMSKRQCQHQPIRAPCDADGKDKRIFDPCPSLKSPSWSPSSARLYQLPPSMALWLRETKE